MATSTNGSRIAGIPITWARRATGALGRVVEFARFEYCAGVPTTTRQSSFDLQIGTAISPVTGTTSLAEFEFPGRCRTGDEMTELERFIGDGRRSISIRHQPELDDAESDSRQAE